MVARVASRTRDERAGKQNNGRVQRSGSGISALDRWLWAVEINTLVSRGRNVPDLGTRQ